MHVGGNFCDMAKAFACVNPAIFDLNYISMEFEENLKNGLGHILIIRNLNKITKYSSKHFL